MDSALVSSLRSSAPLRLLLFTDIFTAEAQRNAEIRRAIIDAAETNP